MEQVRQYDATYSVVRAVQFALAHLCHRADSGPPHAALTRTRAPLAPTRARRLPPCDVGTLPDKLQDGHCAISQQQDVQRDTPVACTVAMLAHSHSLINARCKATSWACAPKGRLAVEALPDQRVAVQE